MKKEKITKGQIGFIQKIKIRKWIKAGVFFILILSLFLTGIIVTHTRFNWFTLVAVLFCLPFAKYLVNAIVYSPYKSIDKSVEDELRNICGITPVYFEYIFNDDRNFYTADVICILKHTVNLYSSKENINVPIFEKILSSFLEEAGFKNYTVKVWTDFDKYKARLEEIEIIAQQDNYLPDKQNIDLINFLNSVSL